MTTVLLPVLELLLYCILDYYAVNNSPFLYFISLF
jgi:hypothetical protein